MDEINMDVDQLISYVIPKKQILHLNSKIFEINENTRYECNVHFVGKHGNPENVFFIIIFLDENKIEINRKIRHVSDFTNKIVSDNIVAISPPHAKFALLGLRVNSETTSTAVDVEIKFPSLASCHLEISNKEESYDNMTDYDKFWKNDPASNYGHIVFPKDHEGLLKLGKYGKRLMQTFDINFFEGKVYSQNGEDGILEFIFTMINSSNKFFVEFGVEDGFESNGRYLMEKGWTGLMMDSITSPNPLVKKEFITAENIDSIFTKYGVPNKFDLLCIDIDYNDYWVWKNLKDFHPRVVVIEYNSTIPSNESKVVEYKKDAVWDGTNYFGASLAAMEKLGRQKGYTLVGCDNHGVNAFFIKDEIVKGKIKKSSIKDLYRSPKFGKVVNGKCIGHGPSSKEMIEI